MTHTFAVTKEKAAATERGTVRPVGAGAGTAAPSMRVDAIVATATRSLLEKLPDAAFVVDSAGTIRAVNERLCRLVERAAEELVGAPVETLEPRELRHRLAEAPLRRPALRRRGASPCRSRRGSTAPRAARCAS